MCHILFIRSSVDGFLGCFHLSAIVSNAAMTTGEQESVRVHVFNSFGYIPRSRRIESYGNLVSNCVRNHHAISTYSLKKKIYLFVDRGDGREGERNINMWLHPLLGTWPTTQACTLTGNQTGDPLVHRSVLNPLSYTSQGSTYSYFFF